MMLSLQAPHIPPEAIHAAIMLGRYFFAGCLILGETERDIHSNPLIHGHLGRPEAFVCAWIFDVSVGNPGEHVLTLRQQLFRGGVEIREHLNRDSSISHKRRNLLNDYLVFLSLLFQTEFVARFRSLLNFRVFGN